MSRAELARATRDLSAQWGAVGSTYNQVILARLADEVDAGGPVSDLLEGPGDPARALPGLRLLGAVHRLVLTGRAPDLARHYPSVGGDGDVEAAWPAFARVVQEHADELRPALAHPPQTNEVGRSAALASGMLVVAAETGLPLRLLELGASAGLNLRLDHYWYEAGGAGVGDAASSVRFVEPWVGGRPPLEAGLPVADRRGCDARPVDTTTSEGRLDLTSYVPPDQRERFERLQAALDVAARVPARVETADAADWLETRLEPLPDGQATVVFHSLVWQYLDGPTAARARTAIEGAGAGATVARPLAWLSFEAPEPSKAGESHTPDYLRCEVRLRTWPGGEERLLAEAGPHGLPVSWRA